MGLAGIVSTQRNTSTACLPDVVKTALKGVAERFGEVTVTSTGRKLKKGARRGSMHLSCRAADFRVSGNTTGMMAWLRDQKGLGGVKRYSNGIIHIDNGPSRSW